MSDELATWLMLPEGAPDVHQLLRRPAWHVQAACRGMGFDTFFPAPGSSQEPAKEICAGCLVRVECRQFALESGDWYLGGVWGGAGERLRRKPRRGSAHAKQTAAGNQTSV